MQEAVKSFEFSFRHMMNDLQLCSHQIESMWFVLSFSCPPFNFLSFFFFVSPSDTKFGELLSRMQQLDAKVQALDARCSSLREQEEANIDANELLTQLSR